MIIRVGDNIKVKVTNVTDDGLDVTHNNFQGLVRIIDLDWDTHGLLERIYECYSPLDQIDVKVMAVDGNRFRGSVKDLYPEKNPWRNPEIYKIGSVFKGCIFKETDFGYFLKLNTGAISLLKKPVIVSAHYEEGDSVEIVVSSVDSALEKLIVELAKPTDSNNR